MREIALDKQKLASNLWHSQQINKRLAKQMEMQHISFQETTDRMQQEIHEIRKTLINTKVFYSNMSSIRFDDS